MIRLGSLRVDGRDAPLGVAGRPRLSWVIESDEPGVHQTEARVTVRDATGTLWTGATTTEQWILAPESADVTHLDWTVEARVADRWITGGSSFVTGLRDWTGAAWIGGEGAAAPLLRGVFETAPAVRARLHLAAGGLAAAWINAEPVSDEVLGPSASDWMHRVRYSVTDVTHLIAGGTNVLALELGRGFYGITTPNVWGWHTAPWHGDPCVRALLIVEAADGTTTRFGTGDGFRWVSGPTLADSFYEGTLYDATADRPGWRTSGFDDGAWLPARPVAGPPGALEPRREPPIRIVETLQPASLERRGDRIVATFPKQVAGWARIRTAGAKPVLLRYGEKVDERGEVVAANALTEGRFQTDEIRGDPGVWEPQFAYFGFQHVEVSGEVASIEARVLHNDVARTGRFTASLDLFGRVHEATVATVLNNLHHAPTDTPTYEKNGWTGDAALGAAMMLRSLDAAPLLEQWLDDLADSRAPDGRPALIAPDPGWCWEGQMASPPWNAAYVLVPWELYLHTGDRRILERHYGGMTRYVRLEHAESDGGLSASGLGDFLPPDTEGNPDEDLRLCGTAFVFHATTTLAAIARVLGRDADADEFDAAAGRIAEAFNAEWLTPDGYRDAIGGRRQVHQVLALAFGLVPEPAVATVVGALVDDIRQRDDHLWVGALGTKHLLRVLTEHGHADLALRVATRTDAPSWGAWFETGATTMWEHWSNARSRDHYFLGTIDDWFFGDLAGVGILEPGYVRVAVDPVAPDGLDGVEATVGTPLGPLRVGWERDGDALLIRLRVPVGCTVEVAGAAYGSGEHDVRRERA